ncbi:MAG: type IX secretion system membrane protein PorP/SprF [Cytophagales bacterium]|nr:MAG: type IX secretion system membrane protein PorP/SprF [Cytophagales bacterium]
MSLKLSKQLLFSFLLLLSFLHTSNIAKAQEDYNLMQYNYTPMLTNPGMFTEDRNIKFILNYRNQPNVTGDNFRTAMFSFIYPFINKYTGQRWGGLGVGLVNDLPGNFLQNNGVLLGYAHNFKLAARRNYHFLSVGLQGGYYQRSVNIAGLSTINQYNNGVFDPNIPVNENTASNTRNYFVVTPGVMWQMNDSTGKQKAFLGFSIFNTNTPNNSFYNEVVYRLPIHYVTVGGYTVYERGLLSVTPTFRWIHRAGSNEILLGAWTKYKLMGSSNEKSFLKPGYATLGLWYNENEAFVASVGFDQPRYFVSFNLDFPVSNNATKWQGNTVFEIALGFKIERKVLKRLDPAEIVDPYPLKLDTPQITGINLPIVAFPPPKIEPKKKKEVKDVQEDGAFRFKIGSSELDDASKRLLDSVALVMQEHPDAVIVVSGHTCDIGTFESNMRLSEQRAAAMKDYIAKYSNIDPNRIQTKGYGPTKPILPNTNEPNRAQNRRVAFKISYSTSEESEDDGYGEEEE